MNSNDFVDVKIQNGILRGKVFKDENDKLHYYSFTGVPYAKPPVGDLRFREAQPIEPWTNIKDVISKEDICFSQTHVVTKKNVGVEELVLNVYTPELPGPQKKPLPVMVYIHQGGFQYGAACKDEHGPDFLVSGGVVHVSFTYRLGMFGFLCLDIPECPGNMGLKDQVLALKWVQRNIASFNGDPSNVTIFGTSAGSASVHYHLMSPMSTGLFHKAIMHSGTAVNHWALRRNPLDLAYEAANILGISYTTHNELFIKLQKRSTEELINVATKLTLDPLTVSLAFLPVVEKKFDGVENFLADEPLTLMANGQFKTVPTMIGVCEHESLYVRMLIPELYKTLGKAKNPESFVNKLLKNTENPGIHSKILDVYGDDEVNLPLEFFSDVDFRSGFYYTVEHLTKRNPQVYIFQFSYTGQLNYGSYYMELKELLAGATHLDDLGYLVSAKMLPSKRISKTDVLVRDRMVRMWTDFAKYGNPTPAVNDLIKTIWSPATNNEFNCLDMRSELSLMKNAYAKQRDLWLPIYAKYAQLYSKQ